MGKVIEISFDATNMTIDEIREEARNRNWRGLRINTEKFARTGVLTVLRLNNRGNHDNG